MSFVLLFSAFFFLFKYRILCNSKTKIDFLCLKLISDAQKPNGNFFANLLMGCHSMLPALEMVCYCMSSTLITCFRYSIRNFRGGCSFFNILFPILLPSFNICKPYSHFIPIYTQVFFYTGKKSSPLIRSHLTQSVGYAYSDCVPCLELTLWFLHMHIDLLVVVTLLAFILETVHPRLQKKVGAM